MQLRNYNHEDYLFLPPIQITSPEQFVPLFLVSHTPVHYPLFHSLLLSEGTDIRVPSEKTVTEDREEMKQILLSQLNYPYPKSYSLPIHKDTFFYADSISRIPSVAFPGIILGEDDFVDTAPQPNVIYHLGCWLGFNVTGSSINNVSKMFPFEDYLNSGQPIFKKTITPHVLFVVKAKLIPYLRARMYLELPFDLPVTDFKMLRNSNDASALPKEISSYVKTLQPTVEYLTADEMLAYLIGPDTEPRFGVKEKAEVIKKVQEMINHPEIIKPAMEYA